MIPPHCSFDILKRSEGHNAVDKLSYILRCPMTDLNTGEYYDHPDKGPCLDSKIVLPPNPPPWAQALEDDPEAFGSLVERTEPRKDSQLFREVIISGPHMFTIGQLKVLFQNIARNIFAKDEMICLYAIHPPDPKGDPLNYHAHFQLSMRKIDLNGFGNKDRTLNRKAKLKEWRKQCETEINLHLKRYGYQERVDYRSLKDQGLKREPTKRMGARATYLERLGIKTRIGNENREIEKRNQRREFIQQALTNLTKTENKMFCPIHIKSNGLLNQQNKIADHLEGTQRLLNKITDLLLLRAYCERNLQSELIKWSEHVDTMTQCQHENQNVNIISQSSLVWKQPPSNFLGIQHFLANYILAAQEPQPPDKYMKVNGHSNTLTDGDDLWDQQLLEIDRMIEHENTQQELLLESNFSTEETMEIQPYGHEFSNNPHQQVERQLFLEI